MTPTPFDPINMASKDEPVREDTILVSLSTLNAPSRLSFPERRFSLTPVKNKIQIGRASKDQAKGIIAALDNGWFDNPVMSRFHAEIVANFDTKIVSIRDVGSLHGTFLNGAERTLEKNKDAVIQAGDEITFGTNIWRGSDRIAPTSVAVELEHKIAIIEKSTPFSIRVPETSDVEDEDISDDESEDDANDCKIIDVVANSPRSGGADISTDDKTQPVAIVDEPRRSTLYDLTEGQDAPHVTAEKSCIDLTASARHSSTNPELTHSENVPEHVESMTPADVEPEVTSLDADEKSLEEDRVFTIRHQAEAHHRVMTDLLSDARISLDEAMKELISSDDDDVLDSDSTSPQLTTMLFSTDIYDDAADEDKDDEYMASSADDSSDESESDSEMDSSGSSENEVLDDLQSHGNDGVLELEDGPSTAKMQHDTAALDVLPPLADVSPFGRPLYMDADTSTLQPLPPLPPLPPLNYFKLAAFASPPNRLSRADAPTLGAMYPKRATTDADNITGTQAATTPLSLGDKTGKHEFFAAREENKANFVAGARPQPTSGLPRWVLPPAKPSSLTDEGFPSAASYLASEKHNLEDSFLPWRNDVPWGDMASFTPRSAHELHMAKAAREAQDENGQSEGRRIGISDIVDAAQNDGVRKPALAAQKAEKRKAADISDVTESELKWLLTERCSNRVEQDSMSTPQASADLPVIKLRKVAPLVSFDPRLPPVQQLPVPVASHHADPARPVKRLRRIAERIGYAALGGATVGAVVFGSLILTAPTF